MTGTGKRLPPALATLLLLGARAADACSLCATAAFDLILPPVLAWAGLSIVLFLTAALIGDLRGARSPGVPRLRWAMVIAFAVLVIGAGLLGLGLLCLLLIPVIVLCLRCLRGRRSPEWSDRAWRDLRAFSWIAAAAFLALLLSSIWIHLDRTRAEYVLQWEATGPGRRALDQLTAAGEQALPELRLIADQGGSWTAVAAARAVARHGTAEADALRLIDVLDRLEGSPDLLDIERAELEEGLRRLTGLDVPPGSSAAQWREAWMALSRGDGLEPEESAEVSE
jgi:hypothetical protein